MAVPAELGPIERYDHFNKLTLAALGFALEEAQKHGDNFIGTEHLLLGVLDTPPEDNPGFGLLDRLGVDMEKVRRDVTFIIGPKTHEYPGPIGLTLRSKLVIELSVEEARLAGSSYIGTDHFLLGIIRENNGVAGCVLEAAGASLDRARIAARRQNP